MAPIWAFHWMFNWFLLNITNSSYSSFPAIKGTIVRSGPGKLQLGNRVTINSDATTNPVGMRQQSMFYIGPGAYIKIGNNVGITNSLFYSINNIEVEDDVLIGGGCQILDNDFHPISYSDRRDHANQAVLSAPIIIGKGAFIGTSTIILKGVHIGSGSVVAAGSVVVKSIPEGEIWGGNPAKFIKKIREL